MKFYDIGGFVDDDGDAWDMVVQAESVEQARDIWAEENSALWSAERLTLGGWDDFIAQGHRVEKEDLMRISELTPPRNNEPGAFDYALVGWFTPELVE